MVHHGDGYDWRAANREGWDMGLSGQLYWIKWMLQQDDGQVRAMLEKKAAEGSGMHAIALAESTKRGLMK